MEITIKQALQRGVKEHREGKLQEAERLYRAILQAQPEHPDANHNLGVMAVSVNKANAALPLFKTALEANPKIEQFWLSYIDALIKDKKFKNAKKVILQAKKQGLDTEKLNSLKLQIVAILPQKNADTKSPSRKRLSGLLNHYQAGRYKDAEKLAILITHEFPKHQFAWKILGSALKNTGRVKESLVPSQKSVQLNPKDAEAHCSLGVRLKELGRFEEAEASLRQAITLEPKFAKAHYNLGNMLLELKKLDEAEASYRHAIELKADYPKAHYNLGGILREFNRLDEAEACYNSAIVLKPDFHEAYNNLGSTLNELRRLNESESSYMQAIALKPDFAQAYSNLGNTLKDLKRLDEAEASYRHAIKLKADYAEAYLNLCELLEKRNKLNETLLVIKNAIEKVVEKKSDFLFYEALIFFHKEDYEIAERLIKKINKDELDEKRKLIFMKLRADCCHYKKNYSAAFESFKAMNETVKSSYEYKKQEPEKYFNQQKENVFQIKQLQKKSFYKAVIKPSWFQPTFLIGFPRSGTTLLDTILRTHSKIDVVEELPILDKMSKSIGCLPNISMIEKIDNAVAKTASNFYFEELKKHIDLGKNPVVIDKLPLNILQLPLINQVFPESRFILALRHPLDCVLSCWMQNFELNPAMANMVEIDRIVDFYCTVMKILNLSQERYSLNIHRIRYEDLVLDFEGNVSSILAFLNLRWEGQLINYQKTALTRGKISTPSYSQVVKPIYNTATYRWKYYEEYLKPYKSLLAPWIEEYGYSS